MIRLALLGGLLGIVVLYLYFSGAPFVIVRLSEFIFVEPLPYRTTFLIALFTFKYARGAKLVHALLHVAFTLVLAGLRAAFAPLMGPRHCMGMSGFASLVKTNVRVDGGGRVRDVIYPPCLLLAVLPLGHLIILMTLVYGLMSIPPDVTIAILVGLLVL